MWDYATGKPFQHIKDIPHPGSLDAESGVFVSTFDKTGTRLITGGADKTIKVRFLILSLPSFSLLGHLLQSSDACELFPLFLLQIYSEQS